MHDLFWVHLVGCDAWSGVVTPGVEMPATAEKPWTLGEKRLPVQSKSP